MGLQLHGAFNFRDLGTVETADGMRVKRGRIYRSGNLSSLRPAGLERLAALGIRLVIDFRTEAERSARPNRLPQGCPIREEHLPVSFVPELERTWSPWDQLRFVASGRIRRFDAQFVTEAYSALPQRAADALRALFRLLLDPANYPLVMLCSGGRDRTGFASALVLHALGVPFDAILDEYVLTNASVGPAMERRIRILRLLSGFRVSMASLRAFLEARPEYLRAAFESMEQTVGSTEEYLRVSDEEQAVLQSMLLESVSAQAASCAGE